MTEIAPLIISLLPDELEIPGRRGPDQFLHRTMADALDRAAGGPGEGRGYYIVRGTLEPRAHRRFHLREGVATALFAPVAPEGPSRAGV